MTRRIREAKREAHLSECGREISCTFLLCAGNVQKIDENRAEMCKKMGKMRRKCKKMHKKSLFYCVHEIFFVILQPEKCGADERYMSIYNKLYIEMLARFL